MNLSFDSVKMYVIKRNGDKQKISFDKVLKRSEILCQEEKERNFRKLEIDPVPLAQEVIQGIYNGVTTAELDELAIQLAQQRITEHPDFGILASRFAISNMHKNTEITHNGHSFSKVAQLLYQNKDKTGKLCSLINPNLYKFIQQYKHLINQYIDYTRDYRHDYFGLKTLERAYLIKTSSGNWSKRRITERPQDMWMRVALGIHCGDGIINTETLDKAFETYDLMSLGYFTHATPTLFNAGTHRPTLSSCFLVSMQSDSVEGMYATLKQCALISKGAGGIGIHMHNIRAAGSYIRGTNGESGGLLPLLRVFNETAKHIDQGGGKRPGAFAIYLEPWHADIEMFLKMRLPSGNEDERARELFYAVWMPDFLMRQIEADGDWYLMCPDQSEDLAEVWGDEFDKKYGKFVDEGKYRKKVKARYIWSLILQSQIETGIPYLLYKDSINRKTNHQNLGTIKSSNLCTEIVEYSAPDEVAVCNLASVCLPKYVQQGENGEPQFNFAEMRQVVHVIVRNLNKVIDINHYPLDEARNSNLRHRPMGIGVQGLAQAFIMMGYPFDSNEALKLDQQIFAHIYYAALEESCRIAAAKCHPYPSYNKNGGCPVSHDILQFDMWDIDVLPKECQFELDIDGNPIFPENDAFISQELDWKSLRARIAKHGIYNSLLVAPMPTASTAQLQGNGHSPGFEPINSVVYKRRTMSGEFTIVIDQFIRDLIKCGLWNEQLKNKILMENGSIQGIEEIPENIRQLYKVAREINPRVIINHALARGPFVDQTNSMNLWIPNPSINYLSKVHFYGWRHGLKTGSYYIHTGSSADATKITIPAKQRSQQTAEVCTRESSCESCSA